MKRLEFKLNWFQHRGKSDYLIAQEYYDNWLAEMLASATVVYSKYQNMTSSWDMNSYANANTHKALLINIEELPKIECKHEPTEIFYNYTGNTYQCNCGVELVAEWVAK